MVVVRRSVMKSAAKAVPSRYGRNSRTAVASSATTVAAETKAADASPRSTP